MDPKFPTGRAVFRYAEPTSKSFLQRMVLTCMLENGTQMNLQATVFGMHQYINGKLMKRSAWQNLFSMSLGVGLTSLKIIEIMRFQRIMTVIENRIEELGGDDAMVTEQEAQRQKETQQSLISLRRRAIMINVCGALTFLALAYAGFKIAASFFCPHSMVNITGCVVLASDV